MALAQQTLIEDGEYIHTGLWPGLSTFEIEGMKRNNPVTGQKT